MTKDSNETKNCSNLKYTLNYGPWHPEQRENELKPTNWIHLVARSMPAYITLFWLDVQLADVCEFEIECLIT